MDYQAFTNDSLTMMYAAVRGALAADDAAERQGGEPRFKVRDTQEWKKHAADLESEMLRRGMLFEVIDWAEGQDPCRFKPLSQIEVRLFRLGNRLR
jgi:hypothetical protein